MQPVSRDSIMVASGPILAAPELNITSAMRAVGPIETTFALPNIKYTKQPIYDA